MCQARKGPATARRFRYGTTPRENSSGLVLATELVERRGICVGEFHAGAIAWWGVGFGQFELRPGDRAAEAHHEVVVRDADAHLLVRPQDRIGQHLRAD